MWFPQKLTFQPNLANYPNNDNFKLCNYILNCVIAQLIYIFHTKTLHLKHNSIKTKHMNHRKTIVFLLKIK